MAETKEPTWYTEAEILAAIKRRGEWGWLPPERAGFIARHLQLAFSKGFQVGSPETFYPALTSEIQKAEQRAGQ